ncbi:YbaB/EbfC family nucleoid-associated protein [Mycoplasmoides alvi]|uniref:YbaB/EbfC family nucleoid-associated protein n=1 Tax=Mycoplasmoides alvi TaxID=78580 RepID=UPI00051AC93E|nr:YbaB/EbfC family nucleoid-associated protein [Mycoplasmoides alvi]
MNFQKMAEMIKKNQREMEKKLDEFDKTEFDFDYKNGSVKIKIMGNLNIIKIDINNTLIDPEDKLMLQEMIAEAINEAILKITTKRDEIAENSMPKMPGLF